jgi:hypothetical protein
VHAKIGPYEGERLQRLLRQGSNPVTVRRAEILLESGLGASVEDLAKRYHIPESYLKDLISEFNTHGMAAVTAGVRKKWFRRRSPCSLNSSKCLRRPLGCGRNDGQLPCFERRRWVDVVDSDVIGKLLAQHSH